MIRTTYGHVLLKWARWSKNLKRDRSNAGLTPFSFTVRLISSSRMRVIFTFCGSSAGYLQNLKTNIDHLKSAVEHHISPSFTDQTTKKITCSCKSIIWGSLGNAETNDDKKPQRKAPRLLVLTRRVSDKCFMVTEFHVDIGYVRNNESTWMAEYQNHATQNWPGILY